jgi:hypothetical protein
MRPNTNASPEERTGGFAANEKEADAPVGANALLRVDVSASGRSDEAGGEDHGEENGGDDEAMHWVAPWCLLSDIQRIALTKGFL